MIVDVVIPIVSDEFDDSIGAEARTYLSEPHIVRVRHLDSGPASIESEYDEALAGPGILQAVRTAVDEGADAVFITCFADPAVHAAREIVDVPVVGGLEPAVLMSLSLGRHPGVITVLADVVPMIEGFLYRYGLQSRCSSIHTINIPVAGLHDEIALLDALERSAKEALAARDLDVVILGCTGMLGVARKLEQRLSSSGTHVPVVDPTAAAMHWLRSQVEMGLRASRLAYHPPRDKLRIIG